MTTPPPPPPPAPSAPAAAAPAAAPRKPAPPPGAKRARHMRWVRIAAATTVLAVGGFVLWLVLGTGPEKTPAQVQEEGCRTFLDGIAGQVKAFVGRRNRLPDTLFELKTPDSESPYDADPHDCWDTPIDYRIVDADARTFRLRSLGPDRKPDTKDDLVWPSNVPWR
ncbi:MAG: hypothetical protein U1E39_01320 [Planctomycetota bacterium]